MPNLSTSQGPLESSGVNVQGGMDFSERYSRGEKWNFQDSGHYTILTSNPPTAQTTTSEAKWLIGQIYREQKQKTRYPRGYLQNCFAS